MGGTPSRVVQEKAKDREVFNVVAKVDESKEERVRRRFAAGMT